MSVKIKYVCMKCGEQLEVKRIPVNVEIDAELQFLEGNTKSIFQGHGIDIEKYGIERYRQ